MEGKSRYNNYRSDNGFDDWFSDYKHSIRLPSGDDLNLSHEINEFLRGINDISDVKSDPGYQSANDSAVIMIGNFKGNFTYNEENKKYIYDNLSEENNRIRDESNEDRTSGNNVNRIASQWVYAWNRKKEKKNINDLETKERREFIAASLSEYRYKVKRKIFLFKSPTIRYAALAAAVVTGAVLLIKSFFPVDPSQLFNRYYKPFATVSAVTRGSKEKAYEEFNMGVKNYMSGNYKTASDIFSGTILNEQFHQPSKFFLGLTEIELNNPERAVELLESVANTPGEYSGDARWYYGFACLKKGDKDKAIQSFMILSQSKGFYRGRASKILRRLK
ncbi:MAG: tetratricopeptide repeat protein [Bacteroidales bacterium]|nr:tetratricopeptide repeat protein [Bacteroidales bacterium]